VVHSKKNLHNGREGTCLYFAASIRVVKCGSDVGVRYAVTYYEAKEVADLWDETVEPVFPRETIAFLGGGIWSVSSIGGG